MASDSYGFKFTCAQELLQGRGERPRLMQRGFRAGPGPSLAPSSALDRARGECIRLMRAAAMREGEAGE
eukprot:3997161-Pyramimonas_sp.AAC.1